MSSETDKIKAEVEAARLEVVQAEKEISSIRLALRNLAVKAQAAQQAAAAEASKEESEDGQKDGSEKPKDDEDEANSLKITATKVCLWPGYVVKILFTCFAGKSFSHVCKSLLR